MGVIRSVTGPALEACGFSLHPHHGKLGRNLKCGDKKIGPASWSPRPIRIPAREGSGRRGSPQPRGAARPCPSRRRAQRATWRPGDALQAAGVDPIQQGAGVLYQLPRPAPLRLGAGPGRCAAHAGGWSTRAGNLGRAPRSSSAIRWRLPALQAVMPRAAGASVRGHPVGWRSAGPREDRYWTGRGERSGLQHGGVVARPCRAW